MGNNNGGIFLMRKYSGIPALFILALLCDISFGQAIRVPSLEVLVGSSSVGKRIEQLDLPGELFTGTTSGKRATISANKVISKIQSGGVEVYGTLDIVTSGGATSTTTYDAGLRRGTMTVNFSGQALKTVCVGTNTALEVGTIPFDDTIPQIAEGTQTLSLSYSATSPDNLLLVEAVVNGSIGGSDVAAFIGAIFQGGTSSAIASGWCRTGADASTNKDMVIPICGIPFLAGTTTEQVYTLRCGTNGGTGRVNAGSTDGNRKLGGSAYTTLKLTEYTP